MNTPPLELRSDIRDRPNVIVDFEIEHDLLLVTVRNIGTLPAARVRVHFDPSFRGLGGTIEIPRLSLFRRLEFLAPGKAIRVLVDSLSSYFGRSRPPEPRVIHVMLDYRDGRGRRYRARLRHDLRIWADLPRLDRAEVARRGPGGQSG